MGKAGFINAVLEGFYKFVTIAKIIERERDYDIRQGQGTDVKQHPAIWACLCMGKGTWEEGCLYVLCL